MKIKYKKRACVVTQALFLMKCLVDELHACACVKWYNRESLPLEGKVLSENETDEV